MKHPRLLALLLATTIYVVIVGTAYWRWGKENGIVAVTGAAAISAGLYFYCIRKWGDEKRNED
jgi:hypothetical protein